MLNGLEQVTQKGGTAFGSAITVNGKEYLVKQDGDNVIVNGKSYSVSMKEAEVNANANAVQASAGNGQSE